MRTLLHRLHAPAGCLALVLAWGPWALTPAQAERADRNQPITVEAFTKHNASTQVNLGQKTMSLCCDVVVTQGSLRITAHKVDVSELPSGQFSAVAIGSPATFRQKRDRSNEFVEAQGNRVEYHGDAEQVKFIGNAELRVLRGSSVGEQASAHLITYDQKADTLRFDGATSVPAAASTAASGGRVKMVFYPRDRNAASAPAAPASPASAAQ